jgi:hypothetical protein
LELHRQIFIGVYEQSKCAQHELGGAFGTSSICFDGVKGNKPQTKPWKCEFAKINFTFLGHVVSMDGT